MTKADLHEEARNLVTATRNASTSFLQKSLGLRYNEAARIMERLEQEAVVSSPNALGRREVL